MARPLAMRIRSDEIGKELVRIIKDECELPLALKVWRFGRIEAATQPENFHELLPAVLVLPQGADYSPTIDLQGTRFDVLDKFRVVYVVPPPKDEDPLPIAIEGLRAIAAALSLDSSLADLAQKIGNDQIIASIPEGVEYEPDEDAFLRLQVEAKVVALRWNVRWTTC